MQLIKKICLTAKLLFCLCVSVPGVSWALDCGDYITRSVTLTEDLNCDTGYFGLYVLASNVTIDLNGHTIRGSSDLQGIAVYERNKVTIKNGVLRGFWAGVNSTRTERLKVENIAFYEVGHAVIVSSGNGSIIRNNDFIKTSSDAVYIANNVAGLTASYNQVVDNEFYRSKGGVYICGRDADHNTVSDNFIWMTQGNGISLNHSSRNTISGNRILEMADATAIRLNNSSYNEIKSNKLVEGPGIGVAILGDADEACVVTDDLTFSGKNVITDNTIRNFGAGVSLGLDSRDPYLVQGNGILSNRFSQNMIGLNFNSSSYSNYARENNFYETETEVSDEGINNRY